MTSFTKLQDGTWGIRSTEPLHPGQAVEVQTRSGQVKHETVGEIKYSGNGVTVATTARAQRRFDGNVAPFAHEAIPAARPVVNGEGLDQIISDLETALAGLKRLRAAQAEERAA